MITSRDNEKLKLVRKLAERRWRDKLGLFVVEGEDLVGAARAAGIEPVELLVAGESVEDALLAEAGFAVEAVYGWFDRRPYAGGEDTVFVARRLRS